MKVLHILHELKFSGAEIMYVDAADFFKQMGVELYVASTAKDVGEFASSFQAAGYTVIQRPYPKNIIKRWIYYADMIRYIKHENIDVLHIHKSAMRWGMSLCAWIAGIQSVYTTHAILRCKWFMRPWHTWLRWSSKNIFHCTFTSISDSVYNHELNYYGNKTKKIYNWYCQDRFFPAVSEAEKISIRKEINIPDNVPVIISVGGCNHNKRHHDIIAAMAEILKTLPDAVYLHLGKGITTDEEKQMAEHLNIKDNVIFCGNQKDVRKYLIASDIYVMTSRFEGISLTTIEAMGCHIPSVLYDVPGLRDFNSVLETAVIVNEDPHTLAKAVISLYQDKEKQKVLIKNGDSYVNSTYSLKNNAMQIFNLYSTSG